MRAKIITKSERGLILPGLLWAAVVLATLLTISGVLVRASGAGSSCPDWPTCFGSFGLPEALTGQIQVAHRYLTALTVFTTMSALWFAWREKWLLTARLIGLGAAGLMLSALAGGVFVLRPSAVWSGPLHAALALVISGAFLSAALTRRFGVVNGSLRTKRTRLLAPAIMAGLTLVLLTVSGSLTGALNAASACTGWPLCAGMLPDSALGWLALMHRLFTLLAAGMLIWQAWIAWQDRRWDSLALPAATAALVFLAAQVAVGGVKVERGFPATLNGLHAASAVGLWLSEVIVLASVFWLPNDQEGQRHPGALRSRLRDFLTLAKPGIVLLMLAVTFTGMVVAAEGWPDPGLIFWTMLGGGLAAGGSSALNQYIDREVDCQMKRTRHRPLPSGRLRPAEAIAFGSAACLTAFYLLAVSVNLLAALLALAGMLYYVVIYSVWLKRRTDRNVIIGSGAGSIPPLVGWAAVTGELDLAAFFLFAIIFFWSPAHFWALAILRRAEYAQSQIPMLPVVRGEPEARRQIFIYNLEMVAVTLLMPLLGLSGALFLGAALLLGGWLMRMAWLLLRHKDAPAARVMFRGSNAYLLLLCIALVADALVRIPLIAG